MKINTSNIRKLEPPAKGEILSWDDELGGFGVRITSTGKISYIAQARVNGKSRRITLGRHGVLTPDQARKRAREELGKMAAGRDPSAAKKIDKALGVTLREVADHYMANRRTRQGLPLKESTKADIERHVKTSFADWEHQPIAAIDRDKVTRRYGQMAKKSVAQANQGFRVLGALIRYAMGIYRKPGGDKIILENPVDVLRENRILREVKTRTRKVEFEEIGKWWSEVQRRRHDPELARASRTAVDLIAFIALTGLRLTEAKTLKWSEVDLEAESFRLVDPKNRRGITLPLSALAVEILAGRKGKSPYVFPGRSEGHLDNATQQFKMIGEVTGVNVTAHDLRRTFIQIGTKKLKLQHGIVKCLSNHKIPKTDVTLAEYADMTDMTDFRDEADKISGYYEEQRRVYEGENVISIGERRA